MIFGLGKRTKAKHAALEGTRELFRMNLLRTTPPPAFWENAYVLGVVYGTATTIATLSAGGELKKQDLGEITLEVLAEVSGSDRTTLGQRMAYLVQAQIPDFVLAAQRAAQLVVMHSKKQIIGADSDIDVARTRARENRDLNAALGTPTDEMTGVLVELNDMWIGKPLAAALGLSLYGSP